MPPHTPRFFPLQVPGAGGREGRHCPPPGRADAHDRRALRGGEGPQRRALSGLACMGRRAVCLGAMLTTQQAAAPRSVLTAKPASPSDATSWRSSASLAAKNHATTHACALCGWTHKVTPMALPRAAGRAHLPAQRGQPRDRSGACGAPGPSERGCAHGAVSDDWAGRVAGRCGGHVCGR